MSTPKTPNLETLFNTFKKPALYTSLIGVASVLALVVYIASSSGMGCGPNGSNISLKSLGKGLMYNKTYPITPPTHSKQDIKYRIGIMSDLDKDSKGQDGKSWISYFKKGYLTWNSHTDQITIFWDTEKPLELKSGYGYSGRGMELSELVTFDGKLLSVDDRTGIVYVIENNKVLPWVVLADGDGHVEKGFKSEWATVKDDTLYVGGVGKEWTTSTGEFTNNDPMWVKSVSNTGQIIHLNWTSNYMNLRRALNIEFPAYMIHESGEWSEVHQRWFFLPRRSSNMTYNADSDEYKGTNLLLSADPNFTNVKVTYIGEVIPTHGYSSFKFLPGSNDNIIVAIKSEEVKEKTGTYLMAFSVAGKILLPEYEIADVKFEGFEFI